jgi:hypothetical protein
MTQKLNKSIKKMKANLDEVLETQRILLQTKAAEKVKNALKTFAPMMSIDF